MEREWTESGLEKSMSWRFIEVICFLFIWDHITVQSSRQDLLAAEQHVTKQYDWLISDRGPFHHSRSYLSFVERFRQGFTTRYKIYRWVPFQLVNWSLSYFLRECFKRIAILSCEKLSLECFISVLIVSVMLDAVIFFHSKSFCQIQLTLTFLLQFVQLYFCQCHITTIYYF